eukprot:1064627_1
MVTPCISAVAKWIPIIKCGPEIARGDSTHLIDLDLGGMCSYVVEYSGDLKRLWHWSSDECDSCVLRKIKNGNSYYPNMIKSINILLKKYLRVSLSSKRTSKDGGPKKQ